MKYENRYKTMHEIYFLKSTYRRLVKQEENGKRWTDSHKSTTPGKFLYGYAHAFYRRAVWGEIDPDYVIRALRKLMSIELNRIFKKDAADEKLKEMVL